MDFFDDDEKLIWEGTPNKKFVRTHGIICLVSSMILFIPFLIIYISQKSKLDHAGAFLLMYLMIAFIFFVIYIGVALPFKHKKYFITNKKIYINSDFFGSRNISLDIEEIKGFEYLRTISDKWFNLAGVDLHSPSIHVANYRGYSAGNSKFAFMHLTHEDAEYVLKILKDLKK